MEGPVPLRQVWSVKAPLGEAFDGLAVCGSLGLASTRRSLEDFGFDPPGTAEALRRKSPYGRWRVGEDVPLGVVCRVPVMAAPAVVALRAAIQREFRVYLQWGEGEARPVKRKWQRRWRRYVNEAYLEAWFQAGYALGEVRQGRKERQHVLNNHLDFEGIHDGEGLVWAVRVRASSVAWEPAVEVPEWIKNLVTESGEMEPDAEPDWDEVDDALRAGRPAAEVLRRSSRVQTVDSGTHQVTYTYSVRWREEKKPPRDAFDLADPSRAPFNPRLHSAVALRGIGVLAAVGLLAAVASLRAGSGGQVDAAAPGGREKPPMLWLKKWLARAAEALEELDCAVQDGRKHGEHPRVSGQGAWTDVNRSDAFRAPSFPMALVTCAGLGVGFATAVGAALIFTSLPAEAVSAVAGLATGLAFLRLPNFLGGEAPQAKGSLVLAVVLATTAAAGVTVSTLNMLITGCVGAWKATWAAPVAAGLSVLAGSPKGVEHVACGVVEARPKTFAPDGRRAAVRWRTARTLLMCAASGSLVFQQCYVEFLFLEAVLTHSYYESSRAYLAFAFARALATSALVGHVHAYVALSANTPRFAWTAFSVGAAVLVPYAGMALLLLVCSPALEHANLAGLLIVALAMGIAGTGLALASGAVSLISSQMFVRRSLSARGGRKGD